MRHELPLPACGDRASRAISQFLKQPSGRHKTIAAFGEPVPDPKEWVRKYPKPGSANWNLETVHGGPPVAGFVLGLLLVYAVQHNHGWGPEGGT